MTSPLRRPSTVRDSALLRDVRDGLLKPPDERTLPSKYFYDQRGSELFEEITRLDEYYPTRAERRLLLDQARSIVEDLSPSTLVELGAGSAEKTRILLEAMLAARGVATYVPIDVSETFLEETGRRLRRQYPALDVVPVVGDFDRPLAIPDILPSPSLYAFLGSTIGNFEPAHAVALLERIRHAMRPGDALLLGADLHKDTSRLHAAYNDARGITAEFNRNVLRVINQELGADFDVDAFVHRAIYNEEQRRIEMYLVASRPMTVSIPGLPPVHFQADDAIRTEISCKYDRDAVESMLASAGLEMRRWMTDGDFSLSIAQPLDTR